jgi:phthiocerol/phenolphthiocerol synthesis type-I polyketide synthase E
MTESHLIKDSDIAIIGLSCRFPGANDSNVFWQNLREGIESVTFFSDEELIAKGIESTTLKQPNYVKARPILTDVELFDAEFFDFSPREAEITDPQHRIFLECAWESLENAGYIPLLSDKVIGVYAGTSTTTYLLENLYHYRDIINDYSLMIGNDKDFLPTRVSYKFNLRGPSISVQTACSTSLVAVHVACQSLLSGECDIALAGGTSVNNILKIGYWYQEGMVYSPDGHCRAFDAKAKGMVPSDGVGIVVLRRLTEALAEGDHVYAVIKGSAINNDGASKVSYVAPSVEGQAAVILEAQAVAGVDAETISYIETHGTGTELGDPIEIAALTKAFRVSTEKKGFCAIGSLKTNIGHTGIAAGVAGLIKTALALKHQLLPPSLHFEQPNPQIDFANSPFYVNSSLSVWQSNGTPRRAGVSSFGIGGTNAHVILEEAPVSEPSGPSRPWQLLLLSAKTPTSLDTSTANLADYLSQHPDINLADVAYTLSKGRQGFRQRRMLVSQNTREAATALRRLDSQWVFTVSPSLANRSVVFMFSGQGSQYVNMAYELYQTESIFREEVDNCANYLKPQLGLDLLRQILYPSPEQLAAATQQINQTALTQTTLFVVEYALAKLWMSYGVHPQAMIGHSIGEYVAACLANVLSLEDALSLVATRGQMMQSLPMGAMLAVLLPESELQPWLRPGLDLAAINGPRRCVVSGPTAAVEALQHQLTQQKVECRRLLTSHAFHSEMMNPILATFTNRVKQVTLKAPQLPYISNVTGTWITSAEATNPHYWATHLRQTVRFTAGLQTLLADSARILLEVGPGRTLSTLAKQCSDEVTKPNVLSSLRHPHDNQSDVAFLLNTLGQLWLRGVSVDWSRFYANERRQRLPLPTYPFERKRYWIDPPKLTDRNIQPLVASQENLGVETKVTVNTPLVAQTHLRSQQLSNIYVAPRNEIERQIVNVWQEMLSIASVGIHDNFFELGGDSLIALSLTIKLRDLLQISLPHQSVLQSPTIAQLAELIASHHANFNASKQPLQTNSPLVAIRSTGSKVPLFCVHPVGGSIFCYTELVHYLDPEQPVYGLQAKGLDGQEEPLIQIENMAREYLSALQSVQPQGPYLLGGWSFGGIVAFEMAQQLQKQGQSIALLALFDSPPPNAFQSVTETLLLTGFAIDFGICLGSEILLWLDTLKDLEPHQQLSYLLIQAKQAKALPAEAKIQDIQPLLQVFKANFQAGLNYVPQPYPNLITLFQATESSILDGTFFKSDDPLLEWGKLSQEPLEIYGIPASHYTILTKPQVEQVGKQLTHCIEKGLIIWNQSKLPTALK